MYENKQHSIPRVGILVLSMTVVAFILFMFFQYTSRLGKYPVNFIVAPTSAEITLNDKGLSNGVNYLSPGEYELSISSEGFSSYATILVVGSEENADVVVGLLPISLQAQEEAKNDPSFLEFEGADGKKAREEGLAFEQQNPIVKKLPFRSPDFRIDYRLNEESQNDIVVQITAESEMNKELATNQIKEWGYNLEDLEIEFLNWK